MNDIEDEAKKRLQDEIDGKGISVSHTWRFTSFTDLWQQIFGKKKDKPEDQENG